MHPGFFLRQVGGELVVSSVIRSSPADQAGIRSGDKVVLLNGEKPFASSCWKQSWGDPRLGGFGRVTYSRHGQWKEAVIRLVRIGELLDKAWAKKDLNTRGAQAADNRGGAASRSRRYGAYILGIGWVPDRDRLLVTAVLRGSPAYFAGIRAGDLITSIDGVRVREINKPRAWGLLSSDQRMHVELTMLRSEGAHIVQLDGEPLTGILRRLGESSGDSDLELAAARLRGN